MLKICYIFALCVNSVVLLVCSALSMEMLVLQHMFRGDRNSSMVERLQKSEIPEGWDLWNFQSALQKIYIHYLRFVLFCFLQGTTMLYNQLFIKIISLNK